MRVRPRAGVGIAALIWATALLPGLGVSAQSPSASLAPCPPMTETRSPFVYPGADRIEAFGHQDDPLADPAAAARFHAGEDWAYPDATSRAPVVAVGDGRVLAVGTIDGDRRGGIVVIEHMGPFSVPASTLGEPWSYPAVDVDTILTVYEGIDPTPGLVVGACVTGDTLIGIVSPQCAPGETAPCIGRKVALHLELRLPSTIDPSQHSPDWADVGPVGASREGYFLIPTDGGQRTA